MILFENSDWLAQKLLANLLFTSEQPKKNKMAFVGILWQIKLLFGLLVIQLEWYITNTIIHLSVSEVVDIYPAANKTSY